VRRRGEPVKVLSDGEFTKRLTVRAHAFSAKAKEKIESLGGKAELIERAVKEAAAGQ
jgi:large subunit ribosomal protein L15